MPGKLAAMQWALPSTPPGWAGFAEYFPQPRMIQYACQSGGCGIQSAPVRTSSTFGCFALPRSCHPAPKGHILTCSLVDFQHIVEHIGPNLANTAALQRQNGPAAALPPRCLLGRRWPSCLHGRLPPR